MKYLFIDTETTGVPRKFKYGPVAHYTDPVYEKYGRLLELAYILTDENNNTIKEGGWLVKYPPTFEIANGDWHSQNSGITIDLLTTKGTPLEEILKQFEDLVRECDTILAYNLEFDINILLHACYRSNQTELIKLLTESKSKCIMKLVSGTGRYKRLANVYYELYKKTPENTHRALDDVRLCKDVYFKYTHHQFYTR